MSSQPSALYDGWPWSPTNKLWDSDSGMPIPDELRDKDVWLATLVEGGVIVVPAQVLDEGGVMIARSVTVVDPESSPGMTPEEIAKIRDIFRRLIRAIVRVEYVQKRYGGVEGEELIRALEHLYTEPALGEARAIVDSTDEADTYGHDPESSPG